MVQTGPYFSKIWGIFLIFKKSQGRPPPPCPPPLLLALVVHLGKLPVLAICLRLSILLLLFAFERLGLGFWKVFDLIFIHLSILGFFCNICRQFIQLQHELYTDYVEKIFHSFILLIFISPCYAAPSGLGPLPTQLLT